MQLSKFLIPAACVAVLSACSLADAPLRAPSDSAAPTAADSTSAASGTTAAPSAATAPSSATNSTSAAPILPPAVPADQRRAAAASLLMPGVSSYDDALAKLQAGVGGIFITSWADPGLLTQPGRDIHALRQAVGRDFAVAIDFEGGRVQRFSDIIGSYPSPQLMAQASPAEVEAHAYAIGLRLASFGITTDFAPVIDVDGAGLAVVGDRSFSVEPQRAGEYGAAFARGLENAGIDAVFKHYPGHGRASGDTHAGAAYTPPLPELFGHDLVPYDIALPAEPRASVMVGHMVVPGLGDGVTPSSLNPHAYGLLRNTHEFAGVAYTDDLTGMKAITDSHTPDQAAVEAIAAGADVALWSTGTDVNAVIDAVVRAVEEGRIHPVRFDEAVYHVAHQ